MKQEQNIDDRGWEWGKEVAEGSLDWEPDVTCVLIIFDAAGLLAWREGEGGEHGENKKGGMAQEGLEH